MTRLKSRRRQRSNDRSNILIRKGKRRCCINLVCVYGRDAQLAKFAYWERDGVPFFVSIDEDKPFEEQKPTLDAKPCCEICRDEIWKIYEQSLIEKLVIYVKFMLHPLYFYK